MKRTISLYRLFSILLIHLLFAAMMILGGSLALFINIPAIIFVFGGTFLALLANYQGKIFGFIKDALIDSISSGVKPDACYAETAQLARHYFMSFGILGTLVGFVQVFANMSDPESIGPSIAVLLLTILYAIFYADIACVYLQKLYSTNSIEESSSNLDIKITQNSVIISKKTTLIAVLIVVVACLALAFAAFTYHPPCESEVSNETNPSVLNQQNKITTE
jgi:flagellar motor component MotA